MLSGIAGGVPENFTLAADDRSEFCFWLFLDDTDAEPTRCGHAFIEIAAGEWLLKDIEVKARAWRRGYGRKLIEQIRILAADSDMTVYTYGASPDADDFYKKTGCIWDAERLNFKVAPVSGEPLMDQDIQRPGIDYDV